MTGGFVWRAAAAGLRKAGRRRLAVTHGSTTLPGLQAPVEVIRDRWGIPHIYAGSFLDLVFAQGFIQAQDRLWQMDFQRRLVAGRLSEVCGPFTLPLDRWVRVLGLRRAAEQDAAGLGTDHLEFFEAFASGVNACMNGNGFAEGRLPLEFGILRYRPDPWTVADSLSWAKLLAWMLSTNWEAELLREELATRLGPELAAALEPDASPEIPIVPNVGLSRVIDRSRRARRLMGPGAGQGVGSNNWVVSGQHTASGMPILCNDMHLALTLPAVWHQVHLSCPGIDAVGISLPGIPCLISGFNGHVAWGITAGLVDTQDLYRERVRRRREGGGHVVEWRFRGSWVPADVRYEKIRVRGWRRPAVQEVITTAHGPIINTLVRREAGELPLALRWTGHDPDQVPGVLRDILLARDCNSFRKALAGWGSPVVNMVFADTAGDIGYQLTGRIPRREERTGALPSRGWTGESEWDGYIPFQELPEMRNPESGYLATANNRVVSREYRYYLGNEFAVDDRARRICELLEELMSRKVDGQGRACIEPGDMRRIQLDQLCPGTNCLAGHLRRLAAETDPHTLDPLSRAAMAVLAEWDGSLDKDSRGAAVGQMAMQEGLALLLGGRLGPLFPRYKGRGPTPLLGEWGLFGEKARVWFRQLLDNPCRPWFEKEEDRDRFLLRAVRRSAIELAFRLGPDPRGWKWGRLHQVVFGHSLGINGMLNRLFGKGPFPAGGSEDTVWAISSHGDWANPHRVGPPFRFIVDLGRADRAWGVLVPGQSGQLGSRHYDDGISAWFDGRYRPILRSRPDIEAAAEGRLRLIPADGRL